VKRRDLERHLRAHGARLLREGGNHRFLGFDSERSTALPPSRDRLRTCPEDLPRPRDSAARPALRLTMLLRCTTKMLGLLGVRAAALAEVLAAESDWYVNLLWIERRKCLLLTHAGTLFPIFVADIRKADLVPIGPYVVNLIEEELRSEGFAPDVLGRLDADYVHLARTGSRSILGVMNNAALLARYRIDAMGGLDRTYVNVVNRFLRRTPHQRDGQYVTPVELVSAEASLPWRFELDA
jgi:hypothetical protein